MPSVIYYFIWFHLAYW